MKCDVLQRNLSLYLYGELSFDEEEKVQVHLSQCPSCQAALAHTQQFHSALNTRDVEVPDGLLVSARKGLRERIAVEKTVQPSLTIWKKLERWIGTPAWILQPTAAAALLAVSFLGGRMSQVPVAEAPTMAPPASPVALRIRNVATDPSGNGIQISLDETRQRVVQGSMEDPSIRELLMVAARDPNDPGIRAESVDMLCSRSQEAAVRDALLHSVEHDTNEAVRLRALAGLKNYASDVQTRQVLSKILLSDSNPGIRSQAIDVLTQEPSAELVGTLQQLLRNEDNDYVRLRTHRVLQEMKASPEIY